MAECLIKAADHSGSFSSFSSSVLIVTCSHCHCVSSFLHLSVSGAMLTSDPQVVYRAFFELIPTKGRFTPSKTRYYHKTMPPYGIRV